MEYLKNESIFVMNSHSGKFARVTDKRTRREKDEKAIADLREKIPDINNIFEIQGRIGNGTFSTVLLASLKCEEETSKEKRRLFAIKHLIPTSHPNRILKELKCLIDIGGSENVVGIDLCLRRNESVAFVMPYLPHDRFVDYFDKMDVTEVQNYVKNLLIALRRVHKFNIIHRDIKPSNFLYNRKTRDFMLVDFGLAQSIVSRVQSNNAVHHQDESNHKKRRTSISDAAVHDAKRVRHDSSVSSATARVAGITLESKFKMPLKQVNEILTPKGCEISGSHLDSPLSRQVKSAILGVTMTNRLMEKTERNKSSPMQLRGSQASKDGSSTRPSTPKYNTNRNQSSSSPAKCCCFGKNQVCNLCLVKKEIPASRAGTPGYRPPEVLLKYVDQTTTVDMWAVGVIFISILSGVYPFFKAPDDYIALAEIVTIFGDEAIRRTAFTLGRQVTMNRRCKPLDMRRLCVRLRNRSKIDRSQLIERHQANGKCPECPNCQQKSFDCLCAKTNFKVEPSGPDIFPSSAYDLLERMLEVNPHKRISAEDALKHPFFMENIVAL